MTSGNLLDISALEQSLQNSSSLDLLEQYLSLKETSPHSKDIDYLFRKFLLPKCQSPLFDKLFPKFLPYIDINYQNPETSNTTLLMELINHGLNEQAETLIDHSSNKFNPLLTDNSNENYFFKILASPKDLNKFNLFQKIYSFISTITTSSTFSCLNGTNIEGYNLLMLSLFIGNCDISRFLLTKDIELLYTNTLNEDNIIHCAVKGKNPHCLNLLLKEIDKNILYKLIYLKNKDKVTPLELASKMNLGAMVKLINDFIKHNSTSCEVEPTIENAKNVFDLLTCLNEDNYEAVIQEIRKLNYLNEWNSLMIEQMYQIRKNKKYNVNLLRPFKEIFDIGFKKKSTIYYLNSIISEVKRDNFHSSLELFNKINKDDKLKNDFVLKVNTLLIIIDLAIKANYNEFAEKLLQQLNTFISSIKQNENDDIYNNKDINRYFEKNNLLTQQTFKNTITKYNHLLIAIYQCYIAINKNDLNSAKNLFSIINESKTNSTNTNNNTVGKKLTPIDYFIKKIQKYLKIRIDYINNNQHIYKHLDSLITLTRVYTSNSKNSFHTLHAMLFYYNTTGIQNLKEKKYSYAEYCFKLCEHIIHQNETVLYKYLRMVLYNISLCYFYTKKYDNCYKILSSLKTLEQFANNPYVFFRFGVCCLEKELSESKQKFCNENNNDILSKIFKNEISEGSNKSFNRLILVNTEPGTKVNEYSDTPLLEAISSFKQCLLIMKSISAYQKEITKEDNEEDILTSVYKKYEPIIGSIYMNLLFCLLQNGDYNEMFHFANEFEKYAEKFNKPNYSLIIDNYKCEAYLRKNEIQNALDLITTNEMEVNDNYNNSKFNYYISNNRLVFPDVNYKIALYVNFCKINLMNNQLEGAVQCIKKILLLFNYPNNKDLPSYVLNLIVYYLIVTGKNELVIKTLKYRTVPDMFKVKNEE